VGSGVIYAVIVALWALVLVPMWLRRHDTENEVQSVDRFSNAMGILSRRDDADDQPTDRSEDAEERQAPVVDPPHAAPVVGTGRGSLPLRVLKLGSRASAPAGDPHVFVSRPRAARPDARAVRLKRRRRVLLALGLTLVTTAVAFAAGLLPIAAPLVALGLSAGYGLLLRRAALHDERVRRDQMRRAGARRIVVTKAATEAAGTTTDRLAGKPAPVAAAPAVPAATPAPPVVARAAGQATDRAWQPQPMPLPTYVTAPPATAVPRRLDRDEDWTAQRMLERAEAERLAAGIDASPPADDVWSEATEPAPVPRDTVFDREWFEVASDDAPEDADAEVDRVDRIVRRGAHRTA